MIKRFLRWFSTTLSVGPNVNRLGHHLGRIRQDVAFIKEQVMTNQEKVDAIASQLTEYGTQLSTTEANIRQDIADLKAANPAIDFSALETSVAGIATAANGLKNLDLENPAPPTPVAAKK